MIEHISCTTIATTVEFELAKLIQEIDLFFGKLNVLFLLVRACVSMTTCLIAYVVFILQGLQALSLILTQHSNHLWLFKDFHDLLYLSLKGFHLGEDLLTLLGDVYSVVNTRACVRAQKAYIPLGTSEVLLIFWCKSKMKSAMLELRKSSYLALRRSSEL